MSDATVTGPVATSTGTSSAGKGISAGVGILGAPAADASGAPAGALGTDAIGLGTPASAAVSSAGGLSVDSVIIAPGSYGSGTYGSDGYGGAVPLVSSVAAPAGSIGLGIFIPGAPATVAGAGPQPALSADATLAAPSAASAAAAPTGFPNDGVGVVGAAGTCVASAPDGVLAVDSVLGLPGYGAGQYGDGPYGGPTTQISVAAPAADPVGVSAWIVGAVAAATVREPTPSIGVGVGIAGSAAGSSASAVAGSVRTGTSLAGSAAAAASGGTATAPSTGATISAPVTGLQANAVAGAVLVVAGVLVPGVPATGVAGAGFQGLGVDTVLAGRSAPAAVGAPAGSVTVSWADSATTQVSARAPLGGLQTDALVAGAVAAVTSSCAGAISVSNPVRGGVAIALSAAPKGQLFRFTAAPPVVSTYAPSGSKVVATGTGSHLGESAPLSLYPGYQMS